MTARLTLYAVLGAAFTADVLRDNPDQLFDPATNLRMGRLLFEQFGRRPWAADRGSCE